ncbi:MAG: hypothetical protein KR126chlam5_01277 [Candidatus Anoxychlamydiales bacterium]|nr:hypothetical protein [Candidatus Anoxychlamydiales bacterium]
MVTRINFLTLKSFVSNLQARVKISSCSSSNVSKQALKISDFRRPFSSIEPAGFIKEQKKQICKGGNMAAMFRCPLKTERNLMTCRFFSRLAVELTNPIDTEEDEKYLSYEEFKKKYSLEEFCKADVIKDLLRFPAFPESECYNDFCEIEYTKYQKGERYWPKLSMYDAIIKKKHPKLQKGEKKLSYTEFVEKEPRGLNQYLQSYVIKSLIEKNPKKYEEVMVELYSGFLETKYVDYQYEIGFWKNQLTFEEYKELYVESYEEYKECVKHLKNIDENKICRGYKVYSQSQYNDYLRDCEYGPYFCPGRLC